MQHVLSLNTTMHPALHKTCIPSNDAIVMSGTMCPVNVMGRLGMFMSQMWVDVTLLPSDRLIWIGCAASHLFLVGMPSMTNTEVAPVSETTCIGFISIAPAWWAAVQFEARTVTCCPLSGYHCRLHMMHRIGWGLMNNSNQHCFKS